MPTEVKLHPYRFLFTCILCLFSNLGTVGCEKAASDMHSQQVQGSGQPQVRSASCAQTTTSNTQSDVETLLVVDSDAKLRETVQSVAAGLLITIVFAGSNDEALAQANKAPLIAALIDLNSPGLAPRAATEAIRKTPGNADIPIAFTSTNSNMTSRLAAVEAGGTRFMEKPISPVDFADFTQEMLNRKYASSPRAVILERDVTLTATISRSLSEGKYETTAINDPDALFSQLEAVRPNVLVLGNQFDRVWGSDICRAIHSSNPWRSLPVIIVGNMEQNARLRAYQGGAADVIAIPFINEELLARVRAAEQHTQFLRDRAEKDPLTGLMRRKTFEEALAGAIRTSEYTHRPIALAFIDIDNFKSVNDQYGHAIGDKVLTAFGNIVREDKRFRAEDPKGRWGGEEFILAFPNSDIAGIKNKLELLRQDFSKIRFRATNGEEFSRTLSMGLVERMADETDVAEFVERADLLLYKAKQSGRNQIVTQ